MIKEYIESIGYCKQGISYWYNKEYNNFIENTYVTSIGIYYLNN